MRESFSIIGAAGTEVQFNVLVRSDAGGELSVQVDADGNVIATDIALPVDTTAASTDSPSTPPAPSASG